VGRRARRRHRAGSLPGARDADAGFWEGLSFLLDAGAEAPMNRRPVIVSLQETANVPRESFSRKDQLAIAELFMVLAGGLEGLKS
jgi:hypothetical protein